MNRILTIKTDTGYVGTLEVEGRQAGLASLSDKPDKRLSAKAREVRDNLRKHLARQFEFRYGLPAGSVKLITILGDRSADPNAKRRTPKITDWRAAFRPKQPQS